MREKVRNRIESRFVFLLICRITNRKIPPESRSLSPLKRRSFSYTMTLKLKTINISQLIRTQCVILIL